VKLASRDLNGFIASKCYMAPETVKICQLITNRKDFNAEPLCEEVDAMFAPCIKKQLKIKNRV
jgi:hypothetical protein